MLMIRSACVACQRPTMDVLALTAALAVAGSPSLCAMNMVAMGATNTGMDSLLPATVHTLLTSPRDKAAKAKHEKPGLPLQVKAIQLELQT